MAVVSNRCGVLFEAHSSVANPASFGYLFLNIFWMPVVILGTFLFTRTLRWQFGSGPREFPINCLTLTKFWWFHIFFAIVWNPLKLLVLAISLTLTSSCICFLHFWHKKFFFWCRFLPRAHSSVSSNKVHNFVREKLRHYWFNVLDFAQKTWGFLFLY